MDEIRIVTQAGFNSNVQYPFIYKLNSTYNQLLKQAESNLNLQHSDENLLIALDKEEQLVNFNAMKLLNQIPENVLLNMKFVVIPSTVQSQISCRGFTKTVTLDLRKSPLQNIQSFIPENSLDIKDYTFFSLENPNIPRALAQDIPIYQSTVKADQFLLERCFFVFPRFSKDNKQPTLSTQIDCKNFLFANSFVKLTQEKATLLAAYDMIIKKEQIPDFPKYIKVNKQMRERSVEIAKNKAKKHTYEEIIQRYISNVRSLPNFGSIRYPIKQVYGKHALNAATLDISPYSIKFLSLNGEMIGSNLSYSIIKSVSLVGSLITIQCINPKSQDEEHYKVDMGTYAKSATYLISGNIKRNIEGLEARAKMSQMIDVESYREDAARIQRRIDILSEGNFTPEIAFTSVLDISGEIENLRQKYSNINDYVDGELLPSSIASSFELVKKAVQATIEAGRRQTLEEIQNPFEEYKSRQKKIEKTLIATEESWNKVPQTSEASTRVLAADKTLYRISYLESECDFLNRLKSKLSAFERLRIKSDDVTRKKIEASYERICKQRDAIATQASIKKAAPPLFASLM